MSQPDLFQAAAPDPEWHRISIGRGRIYRWRLHAARISEHWADTRDPQHPNLWYRPPGIAYELEYASMTANDWMEVRNHDRCWEVWQRIRETPEARETIDGRRL